MELADCPKSAKLWIGCAVVDVPCAAQSRRAEVGHLATKEAMVSHFHYRPGSNDGHPL